MGSRWDGGIVLAFAVLLAFSSIAALAVADRPDAGLSDPPQLHGDSTPYADPAGCGILSGQIELEIWNNGTVATGTYDQLFNWSPADYFGEDPSLFVANLSNLEVTYTNGTPVETWIENNASSSSTNTTMWLLLYSIPSNGAASLYIDACSNLIFSPYGPTGEAPELSDYYAEYDNGEKVFPYYENWAGTAAVPSWSVAAGTISVSIDNGVTLTSSASGSEYQADLETVTSESWSAFYEYTTLGSGLAINYLNSNWAGVSLSGGDGYATVNVVANDNYFETYPNVFYVFTVGNTPTGQAGGVNESIIQMTGGSYSGSTIQIYLDDSYVVTMDWYRATLVSASPTTFNYTETVLPLFPTFMSMSVWNNQTSPTGTYEQYIDLSTQRFPTGTITDFLWNLAFQYTNGTFIEAWIGANATCPFCSTNVPVWLHLYSIPADTKLAFLMVAENYTTVSLDGPTGLQANQTGAYGALDNGRLVFPFYQNWSGNVLTRSVFDTEYSSAFSWSQDNGLELSSTGGQVSLPFNFTVTAPNVWEDNITMTPNPGGANQQQGLVTDDSAGASGSFSNGYTVRDLQIFRDYEFDKGTGGTEISSTGYPPPYPWSYNESIEQVGSAFQLDFDNVRSTQTDSTSAVGDSPGFFYSLGSTWGEFIAWSIVRYVPASGIMGGFVFLTDHDYCGGEATLPDYCPYPLSPSITSATPISPTEVDLEWTNPTHPSGVTLTDNHVWVYPYNDAGTLCGPGETNPISILDLGEVVESETIDSLTENSPYCFIVTASVGIANSSFTVYDVTRAETFPGAPPGTPRAVQGFGAIVGTTWIQWNWSVEAVVRTNVTLFVGPACGAWSSHSLGPNATSFNSTGLDQGSSYCATVVTWNGSSQSTGNPQLQISTDIGSDVQTVTSSPPPFPWEDILVAGVVVAFFLLVIAAARRR